MPQVRTPLRGERKLKEKTGFPIRTFGNDKKEKGEIAAVTESVNRVV